MVSACSGRRAEGKDGGRDGERDGRRERERACQEARLGDNHSKNVLYENELVASAGIFTKM